MSPGDDWKRGYYERLARLRQRAAALGAERDPDIRDLLDELQADPTSDTTANMLEDSLEGFEDEQARDPNCLAPPPDEEDLDPDNKGFAITVGTTIETGVRYGPRLADDCGTIVVTGIPGGGKTTLLQAIMIGVLTFLLRVGIIVFDPKWDTTCLLALQRRNIRVVKACEIRINPLRAPPGVDLNAWLRIVANHFCKARGLIKSEHLLLSVMQTLCRFYGVIDDPSRPWPTLRNVLEYLERLRRSTFGKEQYRESLVTELHGLLDETGDLFDTCDGIEIEQVMAAPGGLFALQTEALPPAAQRFLISVICEYLIQARSARNVHNMGLETLVVLDEAQLVLSAAADRASIDGIALFAGQMLKMRETDIGAIVVAHMLSDISRAVLSAARTIFVVGGLPDAINVQIAAQMMNLPRGAEVMIPRLGRGEAIVRDMSLEYRDAFLVAVDPPQLKKDAIDEATRQRMMAPLIASWPATPGRPITDYPDVMADIRSRKPKKGKANESDPDDKQLTDGQLALLQNCCRCPTLYCKERMAQLNVSDYRVLESAVEQLANLDFVNRHLVQLGSRKYEFTEVTAAGWAAAGLARPSNYTGRGSFLHVVLSKRVEAHLKRRGWKKVRRERPVGRARHPVDVYGISPTGVPTAFEVTLSFDNVVSNALGSLQDGHIQELVFLVETMNDGGRKIEALLQKASRLNPYRSRIRIEGVKAYLS